MRSTSPQRTRLPPQQRKKNILEAARKVFVSHGYETWTVSDIAKEAGVVEGTVLHYFKSKNNLIAEVIGTFYREITEHMEKGVKSVNGARNQIRFVIHSHTQTLIDNAELCSLMLKVDRETNRDIGTQVFELNKRYTRVILDILQAGQDAGEINQSVSTRLVRHVLFGATEHFLWDVVHGRTDVDATTVAEELTELIYSGIAYRPDAINPEINQLILKLNKLVK